MKIKEKKTINLKSNSGFTMTDLVIAIAILLIFAGMLGTLFYNAFKVEQQARVSGVAVNHVMQILEDIDKRPYEDISNNMESEYKLKYSIPSVYNLKIEVSKLSDNTDKEDLIKTVKLTMEYELFGDAEKIVINKLKVKEI